MGRALADRPKSLTLALILWSPQHRAALAYDWRARLGLRLADVEEQRIPWREAWDFTTEILRDPYSHAASALRGDAFVPNPAQVAAADLIETYVNSKRKKGQVAQHAPRPWVGKPGAKQGPVRKVDPGRREALDRMLGITSE